MTRCLATASSLSSLLDTRGNIEIIAEPYRLQPDVTLCVAYSEYTNYVRSLTEDSEIRLFSGTDKAVRYYVAKDPRLYSCFLMDMSFAICKELFYAERVREDATVILPVADSNMPLSVSKFLRAVPLAQETIQQYDRLLDMHEHWQQIKSARSQTLKRLAMVLYSFAQRSEFRGELCLAYDLQ